MPLPLLGSLIVYWAIMSVTPGPNNVLLASSGLRFGVRRTLPQLIGIQLGVVIQALAIAAGLGAIFESQPWLPFALKIFGTLYLVWLAWHFWRAAEMSNEDIDKPFGFFGATAFQFINPKAWLGSLTTISVFTVAGPHYWTYVCWILAVAVIIGIPAGLVWVLFGAGLRTWLGKGKRTIIVNRIFAVLTAATAVIFWLPTH